MAKKVTANAANVLLITTDQMRKDHLGCYGNGVIRTPNLDALAASGVRFDRGYASNPVCMPDRACIATGRLPRNHGSWSNGITLDQSERTIADVLNEHGYHTALFGKGHLSRTGGEPGDPWYDSLAAWKRGLIGPDWAGPYYGFAEARLAIGHGDYGYEHGHYGAWLEKNFSGAKDLMNEIRQSPIGSPQCFTPAMPAEAHASTWLGEVGGEYLRRRADDGKPFMCWVSFPDPHHPFCPPAPYDTMYDHAAVVMPRLGSEALDDKPDYYRRAYEGGEQWEGIMKNYRLKDVTEPQLREIIARTYGMITLVDENVGKLLRTLDETGLAENTIVIFTSDHGDLMGDCGLIFKGPFLLEGLINVPMIWRVPGGPENLESQALFNSCDIAPTILALAGLEVPRAMDGVAQTEALAARSGVRDAAFVEFKSMYHTELNLRTVVTSDWKMTYYPGLDCGEFYDMTAEVPEAKNVYLDRAVAEVRARLEKRLLDEEILGRDERRWPVSHA